MNPMILRDLLDELIEELDAPPSARLALELARRKP